MTWADLASSSIAAKAGVMPFSACRKTSGRPAPRSIKSIRTPSTTSEPAALSAASSIPSPFPFQHDLFRKPASTFRGHAGAFSSSGRCSTTAATFCHCVRLKAGGEKMTDGGVTIHRGIAYANHDGVELLGDLYLPNDAKAAPALVAVHGGGWVQGARDAFKYWGPHLAARGTALYAISYRLAAKTKMFPQAVQDVLASVQFIRGKAGAFGIDPARIGLLGASAGAHL